MSDPLEGIDLNVDDGDVVSDVIVIAVTQRLDSHGQGMYVTTTPNTGFITTRGALEEALDYVRMAEVMDLEDREE